MSRSVLARGILLGATLGLFAAPARAGDIDGKVAIPDRKPQAKTAVDRHYPGAVLQSADRQHGPAVVFLEGMPGEGAPDPLPEKPRIEQRNRQFSPLILPVTVGTTVAFPNLDDEYHNVFSRSEAKELELGRYGKGEVREVAFDKPGLIRLRCEVHSAMHSVVVVLKNRWYAVTDADGKYVLKGVPAGKYRLYAYQEDAKASGTSDPLHAFERDVEVKADGVVHADFDLRGGE